MKTFTSNCTLNHESTLADLLAYIGEVKKAEKTPTPKKLAESGSTVIAEETGCLAYSCGYAVYDNGSGRTVIFRSSGLMRDKWDRRTGDSTYGQITIRNAVATKLATDLEYIHRVTFLGDLRIIFQTVATVLKREGINEDGMDPAPDYGDYLLKIGRVTKEEYDQKQDMAKRLLALPGE